MTRPVVRRQGESFTLTAQGETFTLPSFAEAVEALRFVSGPEAQEVFPCSWLVERYSEDGRYAAQCGAPAVGTDRGWSCFHGHAHVNAEVRYDEGWDYADDDELEAVRSGSFRPSYEPVPMASGRV